MFLPGNVVSVAVGVDKLVMSLKGTKILGEKRNVKGEKEGKKTG